MDRWTQRVTVIFIGAFILLLGGGLLWLASKANPEAVIVTAIVGMIGTALGLLAPSPTQARQRQSDDPPVSVTIDNTEQNPAKVEEVTP